MEDAAVNGPIEPQGEPLPELPRRGFLTTSLITGLTLATTRVEAQAIHTASDGLVAGDVRVPVADGVLPAYCARPEGGGPFPVVLVIEEVFGVHEYIRDVCRRFAHEGYLAVAPELYARQADLTKMTDFEQIIREVISKAPDATLLSDLDQTAAWTHGQGGDPARLVVNGFCRGGRATWLYAAHNPNLRAAVAWYGPLGGQASPIQPHTASSVAAAIHCPLLGLYGAKDDVIPVADVQAVAGAARRAGKTVEIVIYPEAGHAFHADYRPSYVKSAADDGWARTLAWFRNYDA